MLRNFFCRFGFFHSSPKNYFFPASQTIINISVVILHSTKEQKQMYVMDGLKKLSAWMQVSGLPSSLTPLEKFPV